MFKRLLCTLLAVTVLQITVVANAEEKENGFSDIFFEHMKEYIEMNEYHQGLEKASYKLLGDTSNGFHIAYCRYYYGDNVDMDYGPYHVFENDGYVIVGDGYPSKPSNLGFYCFNDEHCYTIEDAYENKVLPKREVTDILNESNLVYSYEKAAESARTYKAVVDYFESVNISFKSTYDETSYRYFGKILVNNQSPIDIFYMRSAGSEKRTKMTQLGYYAVYNPYYDSLNPSGIYLLIDGKVYTLSDALENNKLFIDMMLVELFALKSEYKIKNCIIGDTDFNHIVNMVDVVNMQKHICSLDVSVNYYSADYDDDGTITLEDVVAVQRIIAKIW